MSQSDSTLCPTISVFICCTTLSLSFFPIPTMDVDTTPTITRIVKHPSYYLPGGDLYILIKGTHFRVHRFFFERESTYFQTIFANTPNIGTTPNPALDLSNNIDEKSFARFLGVFYNPKYSVYNFTIKEWFDIQTYAMVWQFPEMYHLAEKEIENA